MCSFVTRFTKSLLATLALVLLLAGPASAAATLVQSKSVAVNSNTATNTVTWDTPAVAGNVLVIIVNADDYITAPNRPSGYTFSTGCGQETFSGHYLFWKVAAGGETSSSYTLGSAVASVWITAEISGLDPSPYDISNGSFVAAAGLTYTTPALTPTTGDRYIIASIGGADATTTTLSGWTNSFIERQDVGATFGSTKDVAGYADFSVTANGSTAYSTTATYDAGSMNAETAIIIAFKVAAGGGPTPPKRLALLGVGEVH